MDKMTYGFCVCVINALRRFERFFCTSLCCSSFFFAFEAEIHISMLSSKQATRNSWIKTQSVGTLSHTSKPSSRTLTCVFKWLLLFLWLLLSFLVMERRRIMKWISIYTWIWNSMNSLRLRFVQMVMWACMCVCVDCGLTHFIPMQINNANGWKELMYNIVLRHVKNGICWFVRSICIR